MKITLPISGRLVVAEVTPWPPTQGTLVDGQTYTVSFEELHPWGTQQTFQFRPTTGVSDA